MKVLFGSENTSPNCLTCQAFCCRNDSIFLKPEEGDCVENYQTDTLTNPLSGKIESVLKHKDNGDCVYLENNACSIYANRPVVCRTFDCRKLYVSIPKKKRQQFIDAGVVSAEALLAGKKRVNTLSAEDYAHAKTVRERRLGKK